MNQELLVRTALAEVLENIDEKDIKQANPAEVAKRVREAVLQSKTVQSAPVIQRSKQQSVPDFSAQDLSKELESLPSDKLSVMQKALADYHLAKQALVEIAKDLDTAGATKNAQWIRQSVGV